MKKSGKKNKMTEEERLIFMEQQRLAEEEMKKNKEDMLAQFLKNKLAKEEKTTKFNLNKLNQQWRTIMREAKSKELKKELEILSQTFERVVDRKESVLESLGKDLMEAEEQYAMAFRSHLQNVDYLIDLQRQRIEQLNREFTEEQAILINEFDTEREMLMEQHQQEIKELEDIMFAMDENFSERELEARTEFQSTRDEIKNRNLEEKHALRVALESVVEDLWNQFMTALKNYQEATEERKKAFEDLKAKDERSAQEIESQMRKLQRINDQITQLKVKMVSNVRDCEGKNKNLKVEKEVLANNLKGLKKQMNHAHDLEREHLVHLTVIANETIKNLKAKCAKGEQVVRSAERCRRLETEEEKVLPFYVSTLTEEEQEDVAAAVAETPTESLANAMYDYTNLENFWKRFNKVMLEKMALEKEKSILSQQNQQFRILLKQYLDGISVNDEILSQENPLFIVNNKTNANFNVPLNDPRIARQQTMQGQVMVQEAAHISKKALP